MSTQNATDMNLLELHVELVSAYFAVYLPESVGEQRQAVERMVRLKRLAADAESAYAEEDPDELATIYIVHLDYLAEVIAQRKKLGALDVLEVDLVKKLETHHAEYVDKVTALVRAKQQRETASFVFGAR